MSSQRMKRVSPRNQLSKLLENDPSFLEVRYVNDTVGKGLFTTEAIIKGQYVGEYKGRHLSGKELDELTNETYLYVYRLNGKLHGIDASDEALSGILRYANDEWKNPNTRMEKVIIEGESYLFLKTICYIPANSELRYDYNFPDSPWRESIIEEELSEGHLLSCATTSSTEMDATCVVSASGLMDNSALSNGREESIIEEELSEGHLISCATTSSTEMDATCVVSASGLLDNSTLSNGREEDVPHAEPNDNSDDDPTYSAHVSDSSDSSSTSSDRLEGFRRPKKFKKSVKTSSLPEKRDVPHAELSDNSDDDPTYSAHESDSSDSSSTSSDRLEGFRRSKKLKKSVKTSSLPGKRAIPSDSRAPVKMKAEQDDTISSSSITVLCANNRKKRKWDKRQVCVYCEKFVSKLPRHLESHHQNEAPVQEFLSHPKKTTPRAQLLKILQNEGNHKHNISVLEVQSGSLIPVKRPSGYVDYRDYLPCDECLGWFVSCDMWKHKKTCFVSQKSGRKHGKTLQSRCALMLPMSESATAELRETVLSRMRYPCPISMAARNDDLICKMGSRVLKQTKASSSTCYQTVSQKMREMARLLRRLREDNSVLTMKDCIDPKMFDNVIDAVRQEAGFNAKTGKYATPSLALKLGHSLSMCATICRAEAIKQEDRITKLKAEDFEDLCKSEWRVEVSKGALQGLEEKRWNAPPAIPMTSEVTKVRQCVFKAIEENKAILQEAQYPSGNMYASLAQAILADIVMFNRRRSGEVQRLKLDDISKAKFGDSNPEIMCCLSQWEQQLCKELTRLEIRGKRGRKVPVLLTKEMSANIKFLSEKRAFAGVKDSNPYLFGIPGCDTSYRGSDCVRKFAQASGVEHPEYITSTKLRKHVATMSQLISLKENELDVLATFMGHDIRTHRHYYRLPEDTLQTAKVAKLLILADRERLTSCAGKSLDAIDLEEPCYETDDQDIDDCDDIQDDGDCGETCQPTDRESTDRESPDRESTDRESTSQLQPMKKGTHKMEKLTWLEEEGKAVDNFFASHVSNCQVPRKHECLECKGQYPILERIEWQKIKFRVHNKINQMKKSRSLLVQHN